LVILAAALHGGIVLMLVSRLPLLQIEVVLKKTAQFEELVDLAAAEAAVAPPENGHYT